MNRTSKGGTLFHAHVTKYVQVLTNAGSVFKIRGMTEVVHRREQT